MWLFSGFPVSPLSSVHSLSRVRLFAIPWTAARQASLSITNSWSLLKLMSIESVMPSSHLILCHPLLLLPPIPPRIRVFSNELTPCMRWPKYWSFSFSISLPMNTQDWSPLGLDLYAAANITAPVSSPWHQAPSWLHAFTHAGLSYCPEISYNI